MSENKNNPDYLLALEIDNAPIVAGGKPLVTRVECSANGYVSIIQKDEWTELGAVRVRPYEALAIADAIRKIAEACRT